MGVINPCNRIQDYLDVDDRVKITFYERYYDQEIAAGSYLIRYVKVNNCRLNLSSYKFKGIRNIQENLFDIGQIIFIVFLIVFTALIMEQFT